MLERVWRNGNPPTVAGNVNWCRHYGRVWRFLRKLKMELPYDLVILLPGIFLSGILPERKL